MTTVTMRNTNGSLLVLAVCVLCFLKMASAFVPTCYDYMRSLPTRNNNNRVLPRHCNPYSYYSRCAVVVLLENKPSWLDDAMEGLDNKEEQYGGENHEDRLRKVLPLKSGIAGFAVDPDVGFCAILAGDSSADNTDTFVPVVVSSVDKDRVRSPEALTMVQLAGGMDLGTTILPPDALAQLLIADKASGSASSLFYDESRQDLRPFVSLTQVQVIPNHRVDIEADIRMTSSIVSTPEREQAVKETLLPKVCMAVKGLPGLTATTEAQVLSALDLHADADGNLDRDGFSNLLETLRNESSPKKQSKVLFLLTAKVIRGDSITQVHIETTDAMQALGVALRHRVEVQVSPELLLDYSYGASTILDQFPAFRPMQELREDAKIMEGFIPTMFRKAQLDNDMKEY